MLYEVIVEIEDNNRQFSIDEVYTLEAENEQEAIREAFWNYRQIWNDFHGEMFKVTQRLNLSKCVQEYRFFIGNSQDFLVRFVAYEFQPNIQQKN